MRGKSDVRWKFECIRTIKFIIHLQEKKKGNDLRSHIIPRKCTLTQQKKIRLIILIAIIIGKRLADKYLSSKLLSRY